MFLTAVPMFAGNVQLLSQLPNAAVSKAIQLDAAGNIYVAGSFAPVSFNDTSDAFVAKLSADGSKLIYFTVLHGSFADDAAAIALGSDGSAYVTGSTISRDFPVTAGALQPTFNPQGASQAFLVKVNPAGAIVYSTYINGDASFTQGTGIAIGSAGEVFVTGRGGPGFVASGGKFPQSFTVKLDASLSKVLLSIDSFGGGLIALDSQGNIFLAGNAQPDSVGSALVLPALPPGAFQSTHVGSICSAGSGPGVGFSSYCPYQIVAKLDATGKLIWATYVTGTYGATAAGMAVDSAGNVIVAGTTNSSDYPVTPGAFQTAYTAAAPPPPPPNLPFNSFLGPPNATGYVTKVNATGTGLVWSTYFGGSFQDHITGMAVNPAGDIILSGRAGSDDLVFRRHSGRLPSVGESGAGVCRPFGSGRRVRFRDTTGARRARLSLSFVSGAGSVSKRVAAGAPPGRNGGGGGIERHRGLHRFFFQQPRGVPDRSGGQRAVEQRGARSTHFAFRRESGVCVSVQPNGRRGAILEYLWRVFQWHRGADPILVGPADQRAGSVRNRGSEHGADADIEQADCESGVGDANGGSGGAAACYFSHAGRYRQPISGFVDVRRGGGVRASRVGVELGWHGERLHESGGGGIDGHCFSEWLWGGDAGTGDGSDGWGPGGVACAVVGRGAVYGDDGYRYEESAWVDHGGGAGAVAARRGSGVI